MKKSILIFSAVVAITCLTAFGVVNWNDSEKEQPESIIVQSAIPSDEILWMSTTQIEPEFFYDIGPRFAPIKKKWLNNARAFSDFISPEEANRIVTYKTVKVTIIQDDERTDQQQFGINNRLTLEQIKLLQSADYSTNFVIEAEFLERNRSTDKLQHNYSSPHLTIVPEEQARYSDGKEALLAYFTQQNEANTQNLEQGKLKPAKLYFTVDTTGQLSNIRLDKTSGYASIDTAMIELLKNTPGYWKPAKNAAGEPVEQELVVSFGLIGC